MYASTQAQKTNFDLLKAIQPFTSLVAQLSARIAKAHDLRKAHQTAHYLKTTNKDFANVSYHDLVQWIMDQENPRLLDGTPVNRR